MDLELKEEIDIIFENEVMPEIHRCLETYSLTEKEPRRMLAFALRITANNLVAPDEILPIRKTG